MSKKDFSKNPALQFVSGANQPEKKEIPEGFKQNPEFVECRTKRVQLLLQPSLYEKIKKQAEKEGLSFNACVHKILEHSVS